MKCRTLLLLAVLAGSVPPAVKAQGPVLKEPPLTAQGVADTKAFTTKASCVGMAEVELSQIASERASSGAIRKFAQAMLDDHRKSNEKLASLAKSKKLDVAATLDNEHKQIIDRLREESPGDLDRIYVEQVVRDHRKAIELFERAAQQKTMDLDFRYFAENALPTLKHHQESAEQLQAQLSPPGAQSQR